MTGGRWVTAATLAAAAGVDLVYGSDASLVVTLVFGPFVASALATTRDTAVAAIVAVITAIALGWSDGTFGSSAHVVRVVAVALGGALAIRLALERARRDAKLVAVTRVAEVAQLSILHPIPDELDGVRLAARYRSASVEADIGGDFYGVVPTPWGVRLVVGDVRGKGLDAVRLASVLLGEFRSRAVTEPLLADVATAMDSTGARYSDSSGEEFATAVLVQFDPAADAMVTVRCGHPLLLMAAGGRVAALQEPTSLPLCMGSEPAASVTPLAPDARVLAYSDGAFEGRNAAGQPFDLASSFARHSTTADPGEVLDAILVDLESHCASGIDDDVILVLARARPR